MNFSSVKLFSIKNRKGKQKLKTKTPVSFEYLDKFYKLGNKATSNRNKSTEQMNYVCEEKIFTTKDAIVNFYPTKSTHWVAFNR